MNVNIMRLVPKSKRAAIKYAYLDTDGFWIGLNEGWEASNTDRGCRLIAQDTIEELRYQIAGIRRVNQEVDKDAKRKTP